MTENITRTVEDYIQPVEVSDALLAFPALDENHPMVPPMDIIPTDYPDRQRWRTFQRDWFFDGVVPGLIRKPDVDAETAYRHLCCVQGTFGIKHQHKEAAVAWLASLWFDGIAED